MSSRIMYNIASIPPAIRTINADTSKEDPSDTPLGPIECRLATLADVDEAATLAAEIFSRYPGYQVRYHGCAYDEFVLLFKDNFEIAVKRASQRAYVAVDTNTNKIQGYLIYFRVGMGDVDDEGIPPARRPTGAFREVHEAYEASHAAWLEDLRSRFGPHYICESLGVAPTKRCSGVASALCLQLANEAWSTRTPPFFTTTFAAIPFYEVWCKRNGYDLEMDGPPVYLDKAKTLHIIRAQIVGSKERVARALSEAKVSVAEMESSQAQKVIG